MRVFVCEFVTSGGLRHKPLPEKLLPEGRRMRDAVLEDLEEIAKVRLALTHDDRLDPPREDSLPVGEGDDPWKVWQDEISRAHVVWPIAPEQDGLLTRLMALARASGPRVIGCAPEAIALAGSKHATARRLAAAGLPTIPSWRAGEDRPALAGPVVTKPDSGAGAVEARLWANAAEAVIRAGFILQPYIAGEAASLSVLCRPDGATLLTVNRQHITTEGGEIALAGLTVGAIHDQDGRLARLAAGVVDAIPGLSGIIGIDLILTPTGPVVVEVNPRITTAYAGLHRALGINPAAFLPELIRDGVPPRVPHLPRTVPVEISLR